MVMQVITGRITMLGNSQGTPNGRTYSLIEIDGKPYQRIYSYKYMENYLERALESGENTKLWIRKGTIFGLEFGGKSYVMDASLGDFAHAFQLILGIALIPVFLIGLFLIPKAFNHWGQSNDIRDLIRELPNATVFTFSG